jgi:hypothetical protein
VKVKVLATQNPRYEGKLRNNSDACFGFMLDPLSKSTPCSKCGGVLAVDFHDFYHQHFSRFHTFMAIIMLKSFTLMSSTRFVVYFISGAHCMKLG